MRIIIEEEGITIDNITLHELKAIADAVQALVDRMPPNADKHKDLDTQALFSVSNTFKKAGR